MLDELNTVTARPSLCFSRTGLSKNAGLSQIVRYLAMNCYAVLS
jgi:hypothetical protein